MNVNMNDTPSNDATNNQDTSNEFYTDFKPHVDSNNNLEDNIYANVSKETNNNVEDNIYANVSQEVNNSNNDENVNIYANDGITNPTNEESHVFIDSTLYETNNFVGNNNINNNLNPNVSESNNDNQEEIDKKTKRNNRRKVIFAIIFVLLILVIGGVITVMVLSEMKIIRLPWLEYPEVVNLSQNEVMIKRKSSFQFSTSVYPSQVHYGRVIYESANPDIASVNPITGFVDAKSNGVTTIKAYLEDYKDIYDTCEVVVSNNHVKVNSISVEEENIDLTVGNKYVLKYSYLPANAGVHYFTYMSSDTSILSVDNKGEVTALASGKALITILDEASGNQVSQEFTVHNIVKNSSDATEVADALTDEVVEIENIKVSTTEINLVVNGEQQITAEVMPEEANQKLAWKSINPNITSVSNDGLVTAKEVGSTEIIVTAVNGMNKVVKVTVQNDYVDIESMSITTKDFSLNVGSSKTIGVTIKPKNATNQKIIWSSSDSNIATVNASGKVTGVSVGKATITAKTEEDGITSSIVVTVNKVSNFINETSLDISTDNVTLNVGGTSYIKTTILPSNASNKKVTWKSSNTAVATVKDGMITGKGPGSATITVSTNNKGISKTIKVIVNEVFADSITFDETSYRIGKGGEISLVATIKPSNATDKTIKWSSSNPSVAKVNNKGLVETLSIGTAQITATTSNNKVATCTITVTNESIAVSSLSLSNSKVIVKVNEEGSLTPVINPATATNQHVSWSINNTDIATVNSEGIITGKKEGIVTITATSNNGKKASATVIIKNNGASVNYLDGSTIKYWVDNSYGKYAISHIWVKDAYNQVKTEIPDKLGTLSTPYNLLRKAASKNSGKTMIGINASGFVNAAGFASDLYKLNNNWKNTAMTPVIIYQGEIVRDYSEYAVQSFRLTYGVNKSGYFVQYKFTGNPEFNKSVAAALQTQGIKYTFGFYPVLVSSGVAEQNLRTTNDIRQAVCQIDKNNFVIITSTISNDSRSSKGLSFKTLAQMMVNMKCKTGYNLDGGGSTSLYYVKKGTNTPTKIKVHEGTYGRSVPDVLYFVGE